MHHREPQQAQESRLEPVLLPPGAGVPWPQLLAMRFVLRPFVAEKTPWELTNERFVKVSRKIERQLDGLSPAQLQTRALIPPMTGLEDSSRFWSIAMTLDHIVIVGRSLIRVVRELDAGRVPDGKADTAKVKPSGERSLEDILLDFRDYCQVEQPALLPSLRNRASRARFRHPWFGPMRHQGWFWLTATHHRLHLQQIEQIRKMVG